MRLTSMILGILPLLIVTVKIAADPVTLKPSTIRTELRVGKSLRPQDEQRIHMTGTNGDAVSIIVKKRDPKQASTLIPDAAIVRTNEQHQYESSSAAPAGSIWANLPNEVYRSYSTLHNNNNSRDARDSSAGAGHGGDDASRAEWEQNQKLIQSFIRHITRINRMNTARQYHPEILTIDQLRADVPEPVVINSDSVNFDQAAAAERRSKKLKFASGTRGKQHMKIGADGIPVIEGVRMPDDEEDKVKTWRNGRVINGIFVPYEKGYVPKRAIQLDSDFGQLLYVRKFDNENEQNDQNDARSFGPFTKSDNFETSATGPYTVDDNRKLRSSVRVASFEDMQKQSLGPFSVKDNSRMANSKLIDYIKTINDKEYRRRDFFLPEARHRKLNDDDAVIREAAQPKIQRRMLENIGEPVYAPSRYYSSNKKKAIEQRSPVMEYAHPEYGVKAVTESAPITKPPKVQYYTNTQNAQSPNYYSNKNPYVAASNQQNYYVAAAAAAAPVGAAGVVPSPQLHYGQKYDEFSSVYNNHQYRTPITTGYNIHSLRPTSASSHADKNEPFYMKLAKRMHDGVQSSFDIFIRPIMEAGKTITHNLGLRSNSNMFGLGKSFDRSDSTSGTDHVLSRNFNDAIDSMSDDSENKVRRKRGRSITFVRRRRALDSDNFESNDSGNQLNDMENSASLRMKQLIQNTDWSNSGCAKRVFCEVMVQQSPDEIAIMEKKMLNIIPSRKQAANQANRNSSVSIRLIKHLSDVTEAIQQRDCTRFICQT